MLTLSLLLPNCNAEEPEIWKVLLAEAADQGYDGMYAVACVIRNRGGNLNGFYGAKRKDLDSFCKRQGSYYINLAKKVEQEVFREGARDVTGGATHFENLQRFGTPYWVKKMVITCKIGRHTFYKPKEVKNVRNRNARLLVGN